MAETIKIFDLETKISDDTSGEFRKELCGSLSEAGFAVKRKMDAGLAPDEFEQAKRILDAFETAQVFVEQLWETEHS